MAGGKTLVKIWGTFSLLGKLPGGKIKKGHLISRGGGFYWGGGLNPPPRAFLVKKLWLSFGKLLGGTISFSKFLGIIFNQCMGRLFGFDLIFLGGSSMGLFLNKTFLFLKFMGKSF